MLGQTARAGIFCLQSATLLRTGACYAQSDKGLKLQSKQSCALQDDDVVRALIGLFKAFAEREKSKAPSQAVDPTQLREALGNLEGDKFKVGMLSLTHCSSTGPCLCLIESLCHTATALDCVPVCLK